MVDKQRRLRLTPGEKAKLGDLFHPDLAESIIVELINMAVRTVPYLDLKTGKVRLLFCLRDKNIGTTISEPSRPCKWLKVVTSWGHLVTAYPTARKEKCYS